jgi:MFS family permease
MSSAVLHETRNFTGGEKGWTLLGVIIVFTLAATDQTIIASAMPKIASELGGLSRYSGVATAYLITSTAMVLIWGKLSDVMGRKPVLLSCVILFIAGSWLSGFSGESAYLSVIGDGMTQLIVSRGLQGIGGGGIFTTTFAIIGDLYGPRERARVGGLLGAIYGLASAIGPLIGGIITEYGSLTLAGHIIAGWRWIFFLNIPLSLVSLWLIGAKMPARLGRSNGKADILGSCLIALIVVPMTISIALGGKSFSWDTLGAAGLLATTVFCFIVYTIAEPHIEDPILPLDLFRNRVFVAANLGGFFISMSQMIAVIFLPLFTQLGQGATAMASGLSATPLMVGLILGAIVSSRVADQSSRYKFVMLVSIALAIMGFLLLRLVDSDTSIPDIAWRTAVLGLGLGPPYSLLGLVIQNSVPSRQIGIATSCCQFFRQIGATVGLVLLGLLLAHRMNEGLNGIVSNVDIHKYIAVGAEPNGASLRLPVEIKVVIVAAVRDTFSLGIFTLGAAALAICSIPQVIACACEGEEEPKRA